MISASSIVKKLSVATLLASVASLVTVAPSMAVNPFTFTGTTEGGSTWNRPNAGNPPNSLSLTANNVRYSFQEFIVNQNGSYNFASTVQPKSDGTNWKNALFLYQNSFNPSNPLTNSLFGAYYNGEPGPTSGTASFSKTLTAGVNYFLVTTGYDNSSSGAFINTITASPGTNITPVPEPLTMIGWGGAVVLGGALKRKYNLKNKGIAVKSS